MHVEKAIIAFLRGYFSTNDRQEKTVRAYESDLKQFQTFVGSGVSILDLQNTHIETWAKDLKDRNYAPASIRRKIVLLKVFMNYWLRSGVLSESPFWRVKINFGKRTQLPRTLTFEEVGLLLAEVHDVRFLNKERSLRSVVARSTEYRKLRDQALIEVMFATGLRVGEISNLNVDDFVPDEGAFRVQGKGRKERMAYIVDDVTSRSHLEHLKARARIQTASSALFLNSAGDRLSPQGISNVIQRLRLASGIQKRITPHMLRHTIATLLLRNGVDLRVVQEFLGHASITMTQRYTHVAKEHMIHELRTRHPSLRLRL